LPVNIYLFVHISDANYPQILSDRLIFSFLT